MTSLILDRPPCVDCDRPMRSKTRPDLPGVPYSCNGRCHVCYKREKRRQTGPTRARRRSPGQFVEDYNELRWLGETHPEMICLRMGMKWSAFDTAFYRAKQRGDIT